MSLLNQQNFLKQYNYSEDAIDKCGLSWEELNEIYELHLSRIDSLEATAKYITDLLRRLPEVHSLRFRIKDAEHLVEKIIRKRIADPNRDINKSNYESEITDLIGIRALHLFKQDWEVIHSFLTSEFETKENPKAYVREGDAQEIYSTQNCDVEVHRSGYRSVHYLISSQPSKKLCVAEVQVRTLFEEGWSEIDHRLRYPNDTGNFLLSQMLSLLNRLAGSADEMSSFLALLQTVLQSHDSEMEVLKQEKEEIASALNETVNNLKLTKVQKSDLQNKIKALNDTATKTRTMPPTVNALADAALKQFAQMQNRNLEVALEAMKRLHRIPDVYTGAFTQAAGMRAYSSANLTESSKHSNSESLSEASEDTSGNNEADS